jgi:predicted nuclease of predicted toxin-antitoxin system
MLDAHVPSAVARGLEAVGIDVVIVATWEGGYLRTAPDTNILTVAANENRVLVSHDAQTLRPLAAEWAERGQRHAGIILIDDRTFRQNDVGGIVRALRALVAT